MNIEERVRELGYEIPDLPAPAGNYVPGLIAGDLLFTSGQIPTKRRPESTASRWPANSR